MSQVEEMADIPSLIDVQLAFEHWRNTRDIRTATPSRLRELAAGLVSRYRQSQSKPAGNSSIDPTRSISYL